jgi:hypothetical protein
MVSLVEKGYKGFIIDQNFILHPKLQYFDPPPLCPQGKAD